MVRKTDRSLSAAVTWVAGIVATVVALTLPLGYFGLGYSALSAELEAQTGMTRDILTRLISSDPVTWKFQQHRMDDLLRRYGPWLAQDSVRIVDGNDGAVIYEYGGKQNLPALTRSATLFDSSQPIGQVELTRSLRELLAKTLVAAALGLMLAAAVFVALRLLPLRALRRAVDALAEEKERAEVTLHSIGDAVITTDSQVLVEYLNPVAEQLTGWQTGEARGQPLSAVFRVVNELTGEPLDTPLTKSIAERRVVPLTSHKALVRRDGRTVAIEDSAAPILDRDGNVIGGVLVFHDVSTARNMAQQLTWQATHDALTNLPNRREFERRLGEAVADVRAGDCHHVLCYMDLDQFKLVNDTCGHAAGDELLRQLAQMLRQHVRESDVLARLGGDEFGLLLSGCQLERAQHIAGELLAAVKDYRFQWDGKVFHLGVSIGIAPITPAAQSAEQAMIAADTACYTAKEHGRGRIHSYGVEDGELARHREQLNWAARISKAIEEDRLELHYQPYLALRSPAATGRHIELLLRMRDENSRLISPGTFIPVAERYNLMGDLDRWVITSAFSSFASLQEHFGEDLICAINLSGTSLGSEPLLQHIRTQMALHRVPPQSICFEITETAAINHLRTALQFMAALRSDGFRFALDDFGAGMSSFTYLRNLPVDYLKIDGAFIKDIATDSVNQSMVAAINQVGHAMGLRTVAEFVDSETALELLRAMGIDYAQGFHIARPQPLPHAQGSGALNRAA